MEASTTEQAAEGAPVRTEPGMPPKLVAWRQKLSEKAKQEKKFRFYSLYSLVSHPDTLRWAWTLVRRNKGAPGVDGVTFEQIEQPEGGVERLLMELEQALKRKTYKAQPVRRVHIEKENGKRRPLGIPVIKRIFFLSSFISDWLPTNWNQKRFHDYGYSLTPSRSRMCC